MPEAVHIVNLLEDSRWNDFIERHPDSSAFHTTGWLEALQRTYRYTPLALTTSVARGPLENAWLFCSIDSWLTGRRWVSLPFSDHCQPLSDAVTFREQYIPALETFLTRERLRFIESRPLRFSEGSPELSSGTASSTCSYCFHEVDLSPDLSQLFRNCHKDSTQRKIQRAEREGLRYEEGRSEALVDAFYDLQLLTRRRHGLPPQPKQWFRNIAQCLAAAAQFRVAYKDRQPVAAILTIRHKQTMVYKYGSSNAAFNHLGGIHLLLWRTIEDAKQAGLRTLDLGRSDLDSDGLITFKDRWGSQRSGLCYWRITSAQSPKGAYADREQSRTGGLLSKAFGYAPERIARAVGERFYRHVG
jgi:hypothetical protein